MHRMFILFVSVMNNQFWCTMSTLVLLQMFIGLETTFVQRHKQENYSFLNKIFSHKNNKSWIICRGCAHVRKRWFHIGYSLGISALSVDCGSLMLQSFSWKDCMGRNIRLYSHSVHQSVNKYRAWQSVI